MSYIVLYANNEKFTPTIRQMGVCTTDGTNQSWFIDDISTYPDSNKGRYSLDANCEEVQRLAEYLGISTDRWKDSIDLIRPGISVEKDTRKFLWVTKEVEIYIFYTRYDQVEFNCQLFYLEQ